MYKSYRSRRRPRPLYLPPHQIPENAKGFRARNGIAARVYSHMTRSRKFQTANTAITVPVPHTTTAEQFRTYILNYMRKRKRPLPVSTSVKSPTEILVWLREDISPGETRKRKVDRASVPFKDIFAAADGTAASGSNNPNGLAPLWPAGSDEEYVEYADEDAEDGVDEDGTPIIYI